MKRFLMVLFIALTVFITEACGQEYVALRGSSLDSLRIGNLHWFELFRDHDSSFVKVKMEIEGKDSIIVLADTNWVKRHLIDSTKKYVWMNDHIFKKVLKIDSLLKFDSLGRMKLPYIASGTREIMLMNGLIKYIDESDSMRTVVTKDYLKDSLVTKLDSAFTKEGQFVYLKNYFFLKPADSAGVYLPVFMNDEGMYKYSAGKILYETSLGTDTVASEEWVKTYNNTKDSIWVPNGLDIKMKTNLVLDLRTNGIYLPASLNDEGMLGFNDNKVKYYDNMGEKALASEDWVQAQINSAGGYWILDFNYLKPDSTNRIVDLRQNKFILPTSLDDEGMLAFNDNKVKYYDNTGTAKSLASEDWVTSQISNAGSNWVLSAPYVSLDLTSRILDLRSNKMLLPSSVNDESMLGFSGNKVVYFDNIGAKNVASENWVASYVDTAIVIPQYSFQSPLGKLNNTIYLEYNEPLYLSNSTLTVRVVDAYNSGILSPSMYTAYESYAGLIDAIDLRLTSVEQDVSNIDGQFELVLTNYATANSGQNVDWTNITNEPATYSPSSHTHPTSEITYASGYMLDAFLTSLLGDVGGLETDVIDHSTRISSLESAGFVTGTWVNNSSTPLWSNISGKPSFSSPLVESGGTVSISYHASSPFETYQNALYMNYSSPLTISGGILDVTQASSMTDGYVSANDWNTFNGKSTVSISSESILYTEGGIKFYGRTLTINGTGYTVITSASEN